MNIALRNDNLPLDRQSGGFPYLQFLEFLGYEIAIAGNIMTTLWNPLTMASLMIPRALPLLQI